MGTNAKERESPMVKKVPYSPLEDCNRPACDDITSMYTAAMNDGKIPTATASKSKVNQLPKKVECPPSSAELGTGTWTLLHTMVRGRQTMMRRRLCQSPVFSLAFIVTNLHVYRRPGIPMSQARRTDHRCDSSLRRSLAFTPVRGVQRTFRRTFKKAR